MKRNSKVLFFILLCFVPLFFACTELLSVKEASLVVNLPGGRFITSSDGVEISEYIIGIQDEKGKIQEKSGKPGETVTFDSLTPGKYLVFARAYEKENCVAYAQQETEIKARETSSVLLNLTWNLLNTEAVIFEVTPPKKTTYTIGEVFDSTGLKVEAVFENGYRMEIPEKINTNGGSISQPIYYEFSFAYLNPDEVGNYIITSGADTSVCIIINWGEGEGKFDIETAFTLTVKPLVPETVYVKGGKVVGAAYTNNHEGVFIAGRTVTLSDFYMGKYEVTQEEYASVMANQKVTVGGTEYTLESNPNYCTEDSTSYTLFTGDEQGKRPVEGVTWYDAVWYCNALSEKEGLTKAYKIEVTTVERGDGKTGYYIYEATVTLNENANGYRLPTEAEWEYAARGGDPEAADWNYVFSGADTAKGVSYDEDINSGLDSVGWYWYNIENGTTVDTELPKEEYGTHQVGKQAANRLGLYDMSGNVWEWCYDREGTVNTGEENDPTGASSGSNRVSRGGSWCSGANCASVSYRGSDEPDYCNDDLGFRVVRSAN